VDSGDGRVLGRAGALDAGKRLGWMCSDHARGDVLSAPADNRGGSAARRPAGGTSPWWAGVAEVHGQAMCQMVLDAELGSEAVGRLVGKARARQDAELAKAAAVLAEVFNRASNAYCSSQGWTEEQLALCERDLQLAFANKVWTLGEGRKIILDS